MGVIIRVWKVGMGGVLRIEGSNGYTRNATMFFADRFLPGIKIIIMTL